LGYQATPFFWSYFQKLKEYDGFRLDYGQRLYLKGNTNKFFRFFASVNISAEYAKYSLSPGLNIPNDSLCTMGLSIGPELNAGLKIVIFKRITLTPSLGFRYYFNTHKTKNITRNPQYWKYNDWDNDQLKWEDNVATVDDMRKGLLPIPYINIGYIFK
jgi:hypothetical protein